MKFKIFGLWCCLAWAAILGPNQSWAQNLDQVGVRLSTEERERLQAILDAPIESGSLLATKTALYRQKDLAAMKLGLVKKREELLREWSQFDDEGKQSLITLLSASGRKEEAYALSYQLMQSRPHPLFGVRIRTQMAMEYLDDGNYQQAKKLMSEADSLMVSIRNIPRAGGMVFLLALSEVEYYTAKSRLNMRTGQWEAGLQDAKQAVEKGNALLKTIHSAPAENVKTWAYARIIFASMELGSHQSSLGQTSQAESTLRDAYNASKEFGFPETMLSGFYARVADYYNDLGAYNTAAKFAQLSEKVVLSVGFEPGSKTWLTARQRLGAALIGQDQWPQALHNFELIDQASSRSGTLSALQQKQDLLRGYVYIQNGLPEKALQTLKGAVDGLSDNLGADHYFTASSRGMLGVALFKTGRIAEARHAFEHSLRNMSAPASLTGDFTETALQQKMRRFVMQSYMQLLAQSAASDAQDAQTLFQLAEQLNVSKVQQALAEAAVRNGVTVPGLSDIVRKEQDAKNEMAALTSYISGQGTEDEKRRTPQVIEQMRQRMREIDKERREYKAQIQKNYPDYFQLIQPHAPSPQDVARQLRPDELFMAIVSLEERTYVWSIRANGQTRFHVSDATESQLKAWVTRVRQTLDVAAQGSRAPAFDSISAHQIYQSLLAPFEDELRHSNHLIVATSGVLAQLPLAVLPRQPEPGAANWLIRDIAISHVPTASGWLSLKRLSTQPAAPQTLLAWGDPTFDLTASSSATSVGSVVRATPVTRSTENAQHSIMDASVYVNYSKIPGLPETRDEVLELAKILHADPKEDLILGAEATRASVLKQSTTGHLAKKQVVVFATHGLLAGDLPNLNQPALAMAASKNPNESPLLTLEDVLGLRLNADWVVLSACNTAGADGKAEEAMSGLARGFFYAGSRSLLVTHWSVESESAKQLTTRTFQAYQNQPKIRRAEALRQAMLSVMGMPEYSHPTYWAPYALVGEGGR